MIEADPSRPWARLVASPRSGGTRWLAVLDPCTSAAYHSRVAALAHAIETSLSAAVVANRVASIHAGHLRLEWWRAARARFLLEARRRATSCGALVLADVRECYASIAPPVVDDRLHAVGCDPEAVPPVVDLLEALAAVGIPGLPIGPEPSAVLANAVLAAADDALASAGAAHLRWVDDFVVFADDVASGRALLGVLRAALHGLGLELSEPKTVVIEGPAAIAEALERLRAAAARYHRRADAHPLPGLQGAHPLVPGEGGVGPRRRPSRAAGRRR